MLGATVGAPLSLPHQVDATLHRAPVMSAPRPLPSPAVIVNLLLGLAMSAIPRKRNPASVTRPAVAPMIVTVARAATKRAVMMMVS